MLYRHEPVFFSRSHFFFIAKNFQGLDKPPARLKRTNRRVGKLF